MMHLFMPAIYCVTYTYHTPTMTWDHSQYDQEWSRWNLFIHIIYNTLQL